MKFLSAGVLVLTLLPLTMSAANAASKVVTKTPPPQPASPFNSAPATDWSGFYVGLNGGNSAAGGTIGYNYQSGLMVLGVEGDYDAAWSNPDGSNYLATARGRLGIAMDQVMPYFTGGYAFDKGSSGAALGGGVEFRVSPTVSMKAEYLHLDLAKSEDLVRVGFNWRFNGGGAYMPHY